MPLSRKKCIFRDALMFVPLHKSIIMGWYKAHSYYVRCLFDGYIVGLQYHQMAYNHY